MGGALAGTDWQGWARSSHLMPLLPICGWTDTGKCYTCKHFCKGLQLSVFHPCLTQGLLGFGFVCFRMRAVNHQLAACCFYFFLLTLQIPFTNRRRTFSALLKRHDCRTRVLLVDSPCNVIPRWFAFIWKQAHLLGPGFGFPLQAAFQQWGIGA